MARHRTKTVAGTTYLYIDISFDPSNVPTFSGDPVYVTKKGDIVLFNAKGPQVQIEFDIVTAGYQFDSSGPGPVLISENFNNKNTPGPLPGRFGPPVLSNGNTTLILDDDNQGHRHYYYSMRFIDPGGNAFSLDPIIVNM